MAAFEELGIMPEIGKAVSEMGWQLPTDIQSEAIPLILGGGDVLMAAETGSGKTGAFCLPVLQIVWESLNESANPKKTKICNGITLSLLDRHDQAILSSDHLSCQSKAPNLWAGVRASHGIRLNIGNKNQFYYEVHFSDPGLARVGWSQSGASLDLGTDSFGFGYGGTAKKSNSRRFEDYGDTYGDRNDVIGCGIDLEKGEISFWKKGKYLGVAFRVSCDATYFPTICTKNARCSVKFSGESNYKPSEFSWISEFFGSNLLVENPTGKVQKKFKKLNGPKAIIIEPSRELAEQTFNCICSFKKNLPGCFIKELLIIGGVNSSEQEAKCKAGVDLIVATPGRLDDFIRQGYFSLNDCQFLIFDELDALLTQNHGNMISNLHSAVPKMFADGRRLQTIVCSATLHDFRVKQQAERLMYFPTWVDLKGEDSVPNSIHHVIYKVDPRRDLTWRDFDLSFKTDGVHKNDYFNYTEPDSLTYSEAVKKMKGWLVIRAIKRLNIDQAIIFCRTKLDCDNLERFLNHIGKKENQIERYSCVCMHSDRNVEERSRNLNIFKEKQVRFLICTDVAARGIDIKGVPFVIQVTLSDDKSNYLHRIGRVGRADRMGLAISLVACVPEKVWYHSCKSRGKNCFNTDLVEQKGCCIWYNELELLSEIEDHLKSTFQEIGEDFSIEVNEFDGKVVYGQKRSENPTSVYENHVIEMSDKVAYLAQLEKNVQVNFLTMSSMKKIRI